MPTKKEKALYTKLLDYWINTNKNTFLKKPGFRILEELYRQANEIKDPACISQFQKNYKVLLQYYLCREHKRHKSLSEQELLRKLEEQENA